jgi:hypothetical protein
MAQVLMREGNVAGARALGAAKELVAGVSEREASDIAILSAPTTPFLTHRGRQECVRRLLH